LSQDNLVLRERIELSTSPLPRECSTTELPQLSECGGLLPYQSGKRKLCAASFEPQFFDIARPQ
jgi:hypothetical protein